MGKLHVPAQQVSQASRESLDLWDQQVLRDHLEIVDPKDPWAHEGTKAMKAPEEDAVSQALKELPDSQDQPVLEETEAKKALEDVQGLVVPEEQMGC